MTPEPTEFVYVRDQRERSSSNADAVYSLEVYAEGDHFVATQQDGEFESLGNSHSEAIVNYAQRSTHA